MRGTRRNPWRWLTEARVTYALKILMILVLAFYAGQFILEILYHVRAVVYILIGAILLAYLVYPAVQRLRRYVPLVAAIAIVYAGILAGLVIVTFFIAPHVMEDVTLMVHRYPDLIVRFNSLVYDPKDPLAASMPAWLRHEIASAPAQGAAWLKLRGLQVFGHVVVVLAGTLAVVSVFIIVPVVTAYLLLDLDHLKAILASIVPGERWLATLALLSDIDQVIGGFIRGQLLVALFVGVLITGALMLLRVPYPYLFGLLAALGDLIPYVGAVVAFVPAFISALVTNGWLNGLLVTVAFVAIYEIEGHFIAPNIVGRQVRLSPFVVIVALLIGGEVAGLFGMLIAVPVAGVVRVVALRVLQAAKSNPPPS
ncbi:MAG: AI-2E family transporter [Candidatus Eremiobacteraeota bacterium]|nr:AI-2E family transporter [Candidatus Eremiobacteraeota bacterium]